MPAAEDETREDETREDETRGDETRDDETRDDETREDKTREDKTREDDTSDTVTIQALNHGQQLEVVKQPPLLFSILRQETSTRTSLVPSSKQIVL